MTRKPSTGFLDYSFFIYFIIIFFQQNWKHQETAEKIQRITMHDIACVMEELMGDRFHSRYHDDEYKDKGILPSQYFYHFI